MKTKLFVTLSLVTLAARLSAANTNTNAPAAASPFKNDREKSSYSIGMSIGTGMKRQELDIDTDLVARGLKDAATGGPTLLTEEEAHTTLMNFQQSLRTKQEEKKKEQGGKNKKTGEDFLAANKSKPDVKTTASGLQYKVLTEGKGDGPKSPADTVKVNYRGTLIDGTEFDSSYKRGEPATFPLNGVIKGWTEGVQLMKPGAKYQFTIPSELAYGENAPPNIGPNSTLIFDIELISVTPAAPSQPITSDIIRVPSAEEIKRGAKPETIKMDQLEKEMQKQLEHDKQLQMEKAKPKQ